MQEITERLVLHSVQRALIWLCVVVQNYCITLTKATSILAPQ